MTRIKGKKEVALAYYKEWMLQKTTSPALKSEVRITRKGWDHIIDGTNAKRRTLKDKYNRMNLLKAAKFVITKTKTHTVKEDKGVKYFILENSFTDKGKKLKIKVIIRKDKKGNYYFYSVMKK